MILCGSLHGSALRHSRAHFYPNVKVSIQWRVLQRIGRPEVLVSPLHLLGLSSRTIESPSLCIIIHNT